MTTIAREKKSVLIMIVSAEGRITYCKKERKRISSAAKNLLENKKLLKNGII